MTKNRLRYRQARTEDLMLYYSWANEPAVRRNAFSQNEITLEEHTRWFLKKLAAPETLLLLFFDGDTPVGQVRVELEDQENLGYLDISVDQRLRGRGFGTEMLKSSVAYCRLHHPSIVLKGVVKPENRGSARAFEKAGFTRKDDEVKQGLRCRIYTYRT